MFKASDTKLGPIAIKFTHRENRKKADREAALMQRASHNNVCRFFEHKMLERSLHAMVLERLTRGTLDDLRKGSANGRIREFECVRQCEFTAC